MRPLPLLAALLSVAAAAHSQDFRYPPARTAPQTDRYFGAEVADPYRWLEDERSAETQTWAKAQDRLARTYLAALPQRTALQKRLKALIDYARIGTPVERGSRRFYTRNSGLQNQSPLFVRDGAGPERKLLDPNKFSAEGTSSLAQWTPSRDGRYVAYARSDGGSDWETVRVVDVTSGALLPERLRWVKVSNLAWQGDGFYYSRYPAPPVGKERSARNENHQVYFHKVGTPQSSDTLAFSDPAHRTRFHQISTSDDESMAFLSVYDRGAGKDGNALWVRAANQTRFTPLIAVAGDFDYTPLGADRRGIYVQTNDHTPRGKVVRIDPKRPAPAAWTTILPERPEPLEQATLAGGKLVAGYTKDVAARLKVFTLDGAFERELNLPGLGTVAGLSGRSDSPRLFYTFTSYNYPATVFSSRVDNGKTLALQPPRVPGFSPEQYVVRQVFYPTRDSTKIPLFLVHRKDLPRDGKRPTLLYGYGGFKASQSPWFSPSTIAWLEQGGVYAVANLRGGNEYGEAWHQAGMRLKKQNVFDDFLAAADYLVASGITSRQKLALQGASNGGLLVAACVNQRPDVCAAAIAQAGVMDMLRFQKFTIGWNWIPEYGSSEASEAEFQNLFRISPVHNVPTGVLPAILVTTADHDDRVVPGHSYKYAAALQAAQTGDAPVLLRVETSSGHGASNLTKDLEETADIFGFVWKALGETPSYPETSKRQ